MKEFDPTQQAFFDHHSKAATPFEAVQKRVALRSQLVSGEVGRNRNPALKAIGELGRIIDPPETSEQKQAKVEANFTAHAQKLVDEGNTHLAKQALDKVGLEMDVLHRTKNFGVAEREEQAAQEYKTRKAANIEKLMLKRGCDKRAATAFFMGQPDLRGMPEMSRQFVKSDKHSLDSMLRIEVNRKFEFEFDRPIG